MTPPLFTDRAVVVTGAGSGIGRAIAVAFAEAGADVLGVGRRRDALEETAALHPNIGVYAADLRADGVPRAIVEDALARWGRLDVLVNNAGATAVMTLAETDPEQLRNVFDLNVIAPSLLAHAALPSLRAGRGAIVNISSTYGHRPLPHSGHYAASKAALEQLTRTWAVEVAADGVRVNAVAPGPTATDVMVAAGLSRDAIDQLDQDNADRIPMGRIGQPAEVAAWVLRLADPADSFVTGQVLTVDGGLEHT